MSFPPQSIRSMSARAPDDLMSIPQENSRETVQTPECVQSGRFTSASYLDHQARHRCIVSGNTPPILPGEYSHLSIDDPFRFAGRGSEPAEGKTQDLSCMYTDTDEENSHEPPDVFDHGDENSRCDSNDCNRQQQTGYNLSSPPKQEPLGQYGIVRGRHPSPLMDRPSAELNEDLQRKVRDLEDTIRNRDGNRAKGACTAFMCLLAVAVVSQEVPDCLDATPFECSLGNDVSDCIAKGLSSASGNCLVILLQRGKYFLSRATNLYNTSLLLRLQDSSSTFQATPSTITCNSSTAGLTVRDAGFAELSGLSFAACVRAFEFVNVEEVRLFNTTFDSFCGGGAVNIHNSLSVTIEGCNFSNCFTSSEYSEDWYRSTAGGLSISSGVASPGQRVYSITNSKFYNLNSTKLLEDRSYFADADYLTSFLGRGGGVSVVVFNATDLELTVSNCLFMNNRAAINAGALHILLNRISTGLNVTLSGNDFTANQVTFPADDNVAVNNGGGALGITLYEANGSADRNTVVLSNSLFTRNMANYAAGVYIVAASVSAAAGVDVLVTDCQFECNMAKFSGAAISMLAPILLTQGGVNGSSLGLAKRPVLQNIVCKANSAQTGGIVFISNYNVILNGSNVFESNNGTALRVISAVVTVADELYFHGNNARSSTGGALHISNGQLQLMEDTAVIFESNVGSLGAALVSEPLYTLHNYLKAPFNPLCFIAYQSRSTIVQDWLNTEIVFASNRADIGSAIYAEQVGLCSHQGNMLNFTTASVLLSEPPFIYSDNTNRRHLKEADANEGISTPVATFEISCRVERSDSEGSMSGPCDELNIYPGQLVFLSISAYDELGVTNSTSHKTYGLFSLQVDPFNTNNLQGRISLDPSLYSVYPDTAECPFTFNQLDKGVTSFEVGVEANQFASASTLDLLPMKCFNITKAPCPVGHSISKAGTCDCDVNIPTLLTCDANRLVLKSGYWGISVKSGETEDERRLVTYVCPPSYCRCYFNFVANSTISSFTGCNGNSSSSAAQSTRAMPIRSTCSAVFNVFEPDNQCVCNRAGYLCGQCKEGTAVTALLNRCQQCPAESVAILPVLFLVDAVVMIALCTIPVFVPSFHFPSSLYALLFYLQIIPYATDDYQYSYDVFYMVVRYTGSLFGLYLPWDSCLSPTTTTIQAYAARYVPALLALVITPSAVLLTWLFRKRPRVNLTYNGVWFVWMLILNDLLATSFSVLNCPILPTEADTNSSVAVWYYDGTVQCFVDPGHVALGLWAIFVLISALAVMVAILFILFKSKELKFHRIVRKISDPVQIGFLEEYKFWFFIDFILRYILIAIVVLETGSETASIFFLSIMFVIYAYFKPYRVITDNILHLILLGIFSLGLILRQSNILFDAFENRFENLSSTGISNCSEADIPPNTFSTVLGTIYCLPVLMLALPVLVIVLRKFSDRCSYLVKEKRLKYKPRRRGRYNLAPAHPHVKTVELSAMDHLVVENHTAIHGADKRDEALPDSKQFSSSGFYTLERSNGLQSSLDNNTIKLTSTL